MGKKVCCFMGALVMVLLLVMLASPGAEAKDTAQLDFADITTRVPKENMSMDQMQRTLPYMQKMRDDMKQLGNESDSMANYLRDLNAAYSSIAQNPGLSALDQQLIGVLQGSLGATQMSMGSVNLDSIDMQIEQLRIQIPQTEAQLINGGQQLFVGYHQLQDGIKKMRDNRALLEESLSLAKTQLNAGLGTTLAVKEAELALAELDTSIKQMESQGAVMLNNLKMIVGWPQEQIIKLGGIPRPNREFLAKISLSADVKSAQNNSYSLKLKQVEYKYDSDDKMPLTKLSMDALREQISLAISTQYYKIVEANNTLLLEEERLAVAEEKISQARLQHQLGLLSNIALQAEEKSYTAQQEAVKTAMDALFWEIENYKAIVAGLN